MSVLIYYESDIFRNRPQVWNTYLSKVTYTLHHSAVILWNHCLCDTGISLLTLFSFEIPFKTSMNIFTRLRAGSLTNDNTNLDLLFHHFWLFVTVIYSILLINIEFGYYIYEVQKWIHICLLCRELTADKVLREISYMLKASMFWGTSCLVSE